MRYLIFILSFSICSSLFAVESTTVIDSVQVPSGSMMTTDNLGFVYIVTPTNDIIKYNSTGLKLATANFKVLGNVTSIDASNPFEIYVFYRDQNKLIFLDNLLNMRGECDLESIEVSQIACVSRSSDNQIWLFDMADLKLKKYSKDLKLISESAPWNSLGITGQINPTFINDINRSILILNNNKVLEFDIFANYISIKLSDTLQNFQFTNSEILFIKNNKAYSYNPFSFTLKTLNIDLAANCRAVRIEKERLFILTDEYLILQPYSEK